MATSGARWCPLGAAHSEVESPQIQGALRLLEGGEMQWWDLGSDPASSNPNALLLGKSVSASASFNLLPC